MQNCKRGKNNNTDNYNKSNKDNNMNKQELRKAIREEVRNELLTKADFGRKNNPFTPPAAAGILHLLTDFKLVEKMKNLEKLIDTNQYTAIKKLYDALCSEIEKYKK